ncbi:flp pilus-assembly TadE/G-like family protein [Cellulomonas cellasea]|uniref:Rv3654c family TadE-like protein n=1 Tax=Cellulomonas cellasea TaxID=43670 RepID=UPI0025A47D13|nr:Rv3654c family TadE-like protein [Cellulomonas cellasea]MDM8085598.1 flp pilus-assembly TadE/G-like family protein [Cellulomonas cellasea]
MSGDEGSGTVLALGLVAVVLTVMLALGLLVGAQSGRSRAQTAADLSALAGAELLRGGDGPAQVERACEIAGEVARRNGGELRDCRPDGGRVLAVSVARQTSAGEALAVARAGPAAAR